MKLYKPVSLKRGELDKTFAKRGATNFGAFELSGHRIEPGAVVFLGFEGSRRPTGICEGRYVFRVAEPRDDERVAEDFSELPGMEDLCQS